MANIVVISLDISHSAPVNTKNMLVGLGHTVTLLSSASASTSILMGFDLMVWCRGASDAGYTNQVLSAFKQGIPLISGYAGGVTSTLFMPIQLLGIVSSGPIDVLGGDSSQDSFTVANAHSLTYGIASTGTNIKVYSSSNFMVAISAADIQVPYDRIGNRVGNSQRVSSLIVKKGTPIGGVNTVAYFAHFDWVYGAGGYTSDAAIIMGRTIDLFLVPSKVISGLITDSNSLLAERRVFAIDLTSETVAATTMSDSSGRYELTLSSDVEYAIFCVDEVASPLIYLG
jgi:hypothetical protein